MLTLSNVESSTQVTWTYSFILITSFCFVLDHCLGGENLKMIAIARQFEAAAKFSGSGGAIVGLLTDKSRKTKMKETFNKNGFVYLGTVSYFSMLD